MCRSLDIHKSSFYAWRNRGPSTRDRENDELLHQIRLSHLRSKGAYGSPRIHADLVEEGVSVSKYRVAKIMAENGIRGRRKGRFIKTTDSDHDFPVAPDLLDRCFDVDEPNQVWVSDLCYLHTKEGWLYLCTIIDLYSRRAVGWAMSPRIDTSLVIRAFRMATLTRQPPPGLIFHSDRGSQYASHSFIRELDAAGCRQSMASKGDPIDNAVAESFIATLRVELSPPTPWRTRAAALYSVHNYISSFYNLVRRHSYLGHLSPAAFEALHAKEICGEVA
jgi:transposase InsO family protein